MNRFWKLGFLNREATFTERDWCFIQLCQDGLTLEKWKKCAQTLITSEQGLNTGEMQLLLDAMSQNPHPDRMAAILLVVENAIKEDSSLHPLLSSPTSLTTILKILEDDNKSMVYQLGEILLLLIDTRSEKTRKAFIPILIDRLQRHVDLEEPPGPFFRDCLILLNGWVRFYRSWTGIEEEEFIALCVNLLQLHPCDVDALRLTYLFLRFRVLPFRYLNNALFRLVALMFTRCTTHFPRAFEDAPLIAWLAAGIMSSVAQHHKSLLKSLVDNYLPTIASMVPVVESNDHRDTCLLVIDSVMSMLIKASRQHPEMMRESAEVLWRMKMHSTWSIKTTIRRVLVNMDQVVDQQIPLRQCTVEGMRKILHEHNVRQECIDRLNLTGSEFLRINPNDLADLLNLNQSETEMVERIQHVYGMMTKITGRRNTARITHGEMEAYLSNRLKADTKQHTFQALRSVQSLDCHYYFYSLMDAAYILDELNGFEEEP